MLQKVRQANNFFGIIRASNVKGNLYKNTWRGIDSFVINRHAFYDFFRKFIRIERFGFHTRSIHYKKLDFEGFLWYKLQVLILRLIWWLWCSGSTRACGALSLGSTPSSHPRSRSSTLWSHFRNIFSQLQIVCL